MPDPTGAMSESDLREYLDAATIPVRLACRTPDDRLWMVSLWFRYRDGSIECATGADAKVVSYLRADDGVAFEISENDPPYRGVRGSGTVTIDPDPEKEVLRDLLGRYLGGTDSGLARDLLAADREEVRIRIDPDKLYTWDFSARMRDAVESGKTSNPAEQG